jgi:NADH pyrophosphatase NudC (nudix superfamily)
MAGKNCPGGMMKKGKVRAIAICLCSQGGRILAAEGYDRVKDQTYYRPLGGTIEFGERGEETVQREFMEEIGEELRNVRYLGTLENIFTYQGEMGHEIVLVYASLYQRERLKGDELGHQFEAVWVSLEALREGQPPIYPDGLLELLGG